MSDIIYFTKEEVKLLKKNGFTLETGYRAIFGGTTITYNNFYKKEEPKEFEYREEKYGYDVDGDYGRGDTVFYEKSVKDCIDNYKEFNS